MNSWLYFLLVYVVLGLLWLYILVKNLERGSNNTTTVLVAMVLFCPVTIAALLVMIAWWTLSAAILHAAEKLRS